MIPTQERFEDIKWVIKSSKSKEDRQCNGKKKGEKETKGQTIIYKTLHGKLKIKQHESR